MWNTRSNNCKTRPVCDPVWGFMQKLTQVFPYPQKSVASTSKWKSPGFYTSPKLCDLRNWVTPISPLPHAALCTVEFCHATGKKLCQVLISCFSHNSFFIWMCVTCSVDGLFSISHALHVHCLGEDGTNTQCARMACEHLYFHHLHWESQRGESSIAV